ncbi:NlpC/P60 family protein [Kushneria sp. AK178]
MLSLSTVKTSKAKAGRHFRQAYSTPGDAYSADVEAALMAEYDTWAGTPYRFGGESSSGIDCSALVQQVFRDSFSLDLPRTTAGQVLTGRRIDKSSLRPGDLVFFRPWRGDRHVGIYVGEGRFMHASSSKGVRISRLDNPYWSRHYWQSRRALNADMVAMRTP